MQQTSDLLQRVTQRLNDDTIKLPALPDIAMKVQQAVADPMMTLPKLSQLIAKDTALSARLIRIANSAWLGRPVRADSLPQAVMRLGFWQIRNVALGMALEGLYESSSPLVRDELARNWQRSMELTAAAVTLLNHSPASIDLHNHTLALACTCSRIGVLPLLSELEIVQSDTPIDYQTQESVIVALGTQILQSWGFHPLIVELHQQWREGIGSIKPDYLSYMQLAGIVTGQIEVAEPGELMKLYADNGCIIRPGMWNQPAVQADYQSILSALRD